MRMVYTSADGGAWDVTQLLVAATWSGDYKQAARTLDVELAAGDRAGEAGRVAAKVAEGDMIQMLDGEDELFRGYVFRVERSLQSPVRQVKLYDGAVYILKSAIAQNFQGVTAGWITRQVCSELGVPVGNLPDDSGLAISFAHLSKPAYSAIMGAWTKVSSVTGYKYMLRMVRGALDVVMVGAEYAPVVLSPAINLAEGSVASSIEEAITQALVVDDKGATLAVAANEEQRARYGTLQAVDGKKDDLDAAYQAGKMLKGPEQQVTLSRVVGGAGAEMLLAGNAVAVNDPVLGLHGKYHILTDEHQFLDGQHFVSLGLSLDAIMDEQEVQEVKEKAASHAKAKTQPAGDPWATARAKGLEGF